jgi:UDP-N-acetylglucosamine--N-acetylmuramyl-(pentapeptide) pyrophosphoryl-undecaprenol N-acetylglucosamine transferase
VEKVPSAAQNRLVMTGMPVRPAIVALCDQPYGPPEEDGPIRLVILGGSQGARILSQVVPDAVIRLPQNLHARLEISQQCRAEDLEAVRAIYKKANIKAFLSPFFTDVPLRLSQAHLVITRSGSSTVAELTALGRPAILVPYKFATDDHQTANAKALEQTGGAWCISQDEFTSQTLFTRLASLFMPGTALSSAAAKSRAFGRSDAAEQLADLIPLVVKAPS